MLRIYGNMQLAQVAGTKDEIEGLRLEAKKGGQELLVEDGNFLYARAIFMGYDLPNGNGDAIPSIYAGTFGPSFIGKHVDVNHQLDPDSIIGRIMATWHVQKPIVAGEGPRVIGRNVFGRDIEGRAKVFGFAPSVEAEPMELQLEGIFRIDRSSHAGDIMARKLIAKEIDSVSQEASTAYCLCPVCAHKISLPWDQPCDHLKAGSLMVKAYKVQGYDHDILAYKVHHEPGGTGLGCVGVPAYDKAKVPQMMAELRAGNLSVEAFKRLLHEQELVWGKSLFVIQAGRELELVASELAKPSAPKGKGPETAPLTPGTKPAALTPGTSLTPGTPGTPGTPLASGLRPALNSLTPVEDDDKLSLYRKLVSAAKAQGRLNRETMSLTRHVALASVSPESEKEGALDLLADRVAVVAETQATIDLVRRSLLAALELDPKKPGVADGQLVGADALGAIKTLGMAMRVGVTRAALRATKNRVDGFMPGVRSLQAALYADGKGLEGAANVGAAYVKAEVAHTEFTKQFDKWRDASFPSDVDKVHGELAKQTMSSFVAFKAAFDQFEAAQRLLLPAGHDELASAVDKEFGLQGAAPAPRRLRMRAGTMDLVAAFQGQRTEERSRAVVGAFHASTAEWLPEIEVRALADKKPGTSAEAAELVNGLTEVINAMGRQTFVGGLKAGVQKRLEDARKSMTLLAAKERVAAGRRVLARTWLKAFAINPSFDVNGSAQQVLDESKTGFSAELAAEVGTAVQAAGGPWPWTGEKAVPWSDFVASKTDDELTKIVDNWKARLTANKDIDYAKIVAENKVEDLAIIVTYQNANKVMAVLKDRQAARGLVAKFFRQPVLADSHWTLFDAAGTARGRFTLKAAARGRLDRHVEIGGKKVFLASWLQSQAYGRDIVAHARRHGLEATLRFFVRGEERQPIAEYSGGDSPEEADIDEFLEVQHEGYLDRVKQSVAKGMMQEWGDETEWDPKNPDDVAAYIEGNEEAVTKKARYEIGIEMATMNGEDDWENLVYNLTEQMKKFGTTKWVAQGRNMGWRNRSGEKEFEAADGKEMLKQILPDTDVHVSLYEGEGAIEMRVSHHDAPTGEFYTIAPAPAEIEVEGRRVRAVGSTLRQGDRRPLSREEHYHGVGSDSIRHEHGPYEKGHKHEGGGRAESSPAWREGEGVQEQGLGEAKGRRWIQADDQEGFDKSALFLTVATSQPQQGKSRGPARAWGVMYNGEPLMASTADRAKAVEVMTKFAKQQNLEASDVIWDGDAKKFLKLSEVKADRGHFEDWRRTPAVRTPDAGKRMDRRNKMLETLDEAKRQADAGAVSPEQMADRERMQRLKTGDMPGRSQRLFRGSRKVRAAAVYQPQTGAEHGAFVALVSAVADALDRDAEFGELAERFPMSGVELTETIPGEFAAANVDFKTYVDMLVPDAQEVIDAYDKAFGGKTTMQALADEFGDKVWTSAILQAMGHGVSIYDEPGVSEKLKELGLDKVRPGIHKDDMGYDEAWQALTKYASQGD